MTADNELQDHSNDHAYFAMMPNMLDDLLNPYQYRLYAHIKRVCGEKGRCWQSTDTIAKACKMSTGKVSECKIDLGTMGLIAIQLKKRPHGGKPYHIITVTDIWHRNIIHCSTPRSPDEQPNSHSEYASSQGEIKKTPLEEDPREEPPSADSSVEDTQDDDPEIAETAAMFKTPTASQEEPQQRVARLRDELGTDPLGVAAVVAQNRAAVANPDMADPHRDFDVWWRDATRAFCAVAHVDYETLKPSYVIDWPRQIKKWADGWEDSAPTAAETVQCLKGIPQSEHAWKTFTSPRQPSFQETMDVMLSRLRGGQPWNAEGKKNGGASGGNDAPQVDQAVAETMARLFDENGVRIRRE